MRLIFLYIIIILLIESCQKSGDHTSKKKQYLTDQFINPINEKYDTYSGKYKTIHNQQDILFSDIAFLNKLDIPDRVFQNQNRVFGLFSNEYKTSFDSLDLNVTDYKYFNRILNLYKYFPPLDISRYCTLYEVEGDDDANNIRYTGYYSPLLKVNLTKDSIYKYPIYSRPDSLPFSMPDRIDIYNGIFDSILEPICYTNSYKLLYNLQLQGSGYLEYPDGMREYISYGGSNKRRHRINKKVFNDIFTIDSIHFFADSLINLDPAYVFFNRKYTSPRGAAHVPLVANHSIAIDDINFPLGSVFLGVVPNYYSKHKKVVHDLRLLFAHDTGGKINGASHIDLYFGAGQLAEKKASSLNKFGKLYLLIPKRKK